jgi:hypothetical protein
LRSGAQIVTAGRSSETPIFAALPLLEGYAPGRRLAHGQDPRARRCSSCGPDRARLHDGGAARGQLRRVSAPRGLSLHSTSVASHTLYENADPFELKEPSVTLRRMTTSKHGSATPSASGRMKSSPASTAATA